MSEITVHHGDSREVLKGIGDASIDSCVCDPPYALVSISKRFGKDGAVPAKAGKTGAYKRASSGFMGQQWDNGEAAHSVEFWAEVFRVLKPGAHVVAFSGTRTQHRQVCAIEDAGFEIRDQLGWLFGSGFPKSHNQKGEWDGWGSALKPAWESICLARKPLVGTIAANLEAHRCGALNIDASRVATGENLNGGAYQANPADRHDGDESWRFKNGGRAGLPGDGRIGPAAGMFQPGKTADSGYVQPTGRWPANIVHDGSDEVIAAFPFDASAPRSPRALIKGSSGADAEGNTSGALGAESRPAGSVCGIDRADTGSAARFFYTAKADAEDRLGSKHPTVKPVDLMAWLCRLVTPPGGTILDPFAGTGTTGLAAMREGFDCILIEREARFVADIERRLAWARGEGRLTAQETSRVETKTVDDLPLFGGAAA